MASDNNVGGNMESGLDLTEVRKKLAGKTGQAYWRGLEEVAETDEFKQWLDDEFPNRSTLLQVDRRSFLKFMGASLALAGVAGCRVRPQEKIVPYVNQPEDLVYNNPLFYATAMPFQGYGLGAVVTSREGRPIKVDGNPDHPSIKGGRIDKGETGFHGSRSNVWLQASILDLYDPDRVQNTQRDGNIASLDELLAAARPLAVRRPASGGTVHILTETVTSPTLADLLRRITRDHPHVRWHQYQPASGNNARLGAQMALGRFVNTVYDLTQATRILSLDGDFLLELPGSVRYAGDYADGRRISKEDGTTVKSRLYAVESTPTLAGANADHRLPMKSSDVEGFARALLSTLEGTGTPTPPAGAEKFLAVVAEDLRSAGAGAVVIPGEGQPPAVHALAHAINARLGAVGSTVRYTAAVEANPIDQIESLKQLTADMNAGQCQMIIIVGGNPVYNAPVDLEFAKALARVPIRVRLGLFQDETSAVCNWVVPESHYLEAWGDLRAHDGTASVVQPLINPLYENSRSALELLGSLFEQPKTGLDMVRDYWRRTKPGGNFDQKWEQWLHDGMIPDTAAPAVTVAASAAGIPAPAAASTGTEVVFRLDPTVWDGRYANNAWLQELPKPISKLTWDNAALVGFSMAEKQGWKTGDMVEITHNGRKLQAPVWVMPGHVDDSITLYLGGGREIAGPVGRGQGFNAYRLATSTASGFGPCTVARGTGGYRLVSTQTQNTMEGRDIVRVGTLNELETNPSLHRRGAEHAGASAENAETPGAAANQPGGAESHGPEENHRVPEGTVGPKENPVSLYNLTNEYEKTGVPQWGMAIDMTLCIGCNACAVACQSENNIPIVGKAEVANGRHMNWLRIDRYYATDNAKGRTPDNPVMLFQPMLCMQCEKAPCEPVCPVGATMHSHEGLNQMIYNRCVGTRYCSNNCPYKVRRFNFYNYANHFDQNRQGQNMIPLRLAANPDVTVRGRGVMEKCTYCVQRINRGRINAKRENRQIQDGEVVTACQQACPTRAISFGNLADRNSEVNKRKQEPHNYLLLDELNTTPRTSYLARVRNPNPALETE